MTKDQLPNFDAKLSEYIKGLQEFSPKDNPHAYTRALCKIINDLRELQDQVRDDWR